MQITKEEAESALLSLSGLDDPEYIDRSEEVYLPNREWATIITLARAGAAVLFPSEEDVERVAKAIYEEHPFATMDDDLVPWDKVAPNDLTNRARARAAIAAMKPEPSHDPS